MSDADSTPVEEESPDLFEKIADKIADRYGIDLNRIRAELQGDTDAEQTITSTKPVYPTREDVVRSALVTLVENKQDRLAEANPDVENPRTLKVELNIDDPIAVVHSFTAELDEQREELLAYLREHRPDQEAGPSLEADDFELVTYIISERTNSENPAVFLGGAKPLRLNVANALALTDDEAELVRLSNEIATQLSGYDRHLLIEETLVLPLAGVSKNPYE
jgi:hypothetical protein